MFYNINEWLKHEESLRFSTCVSFVLLSFNLFLLPVFNGANHSALRPQHASVPDVKGLSRDEGEVEPLEQLRHHNFSLHLKTQPSI